MVVAVIAAVVVVIMTGVPVGVGAAEMISLKYI
jgi:hypothetical protein